MDSSNISHVTHLSSQDEINKHLSVGWVILGVAPGQYQEDGMAYILYSLGWPSEKGDIKWPKENYL